ncbi:MAG: uridine kinase [Eubacteriales bacterium]
MINVPRFLTEAQAEKSVKDGDAAFDAELARISKDLLVTHGRFHGQQVKAIALCGPSCAGKTTTAKKLTSILEAQGKRVHILSIDDFYFDRAVLKGRSKAGKIDFDSPDTIDTEELALTIRVIFDDDENVVEVPTYDFKTGTRVEPRFIPVDDRDIFIIEGIQVFYPNVYKLLNSYPTTIVYINTSRSIQSGSLLFTPANLRLLRRIVRDFYRREAPPDFTLNLWRTVRENEDINIFPYCYKAKLSISSTVCYEIGMLKPYLDEILPLVPKTSSNTIRRRKYLRA